MKIPRKDAILNCIKAVRLGKEQAEMKTYHSDGEILRFFREDIGGILITDGDGNVLYSDAKAAFIRTEKTNWKAACPAPRPGQKAETWDLLHTDGGKTYMVITSTIMDGNEMRQIHHLVDTSLYIGLYRDITEYSKSLQIQKERDRLTGLFNKGKLMEMKRNLFVRQETIAVYNMDINGLKQVNDTIGHEAGDRLIRKAADSLKAIEARNIMPFRVGGDEFIVVAIHVTRENAENILRKWEGALEALNRQDDGLPCTVACGFAFGEKGFDMEEVFALADQRMYEDKKAKKAGGSRPL